MSRTVFGVYVFIEIPNLVILDGAGAGLTKVSLSTEFSHPGVS